MTTSANKRVRPEILEKARLDAGLFCIPDLRNRQKPCGFVSFHNILLTSAQ
jgi:hypothetical protein